MRTLLPRQSAALKIRPFQRRDLTALRNLAHYSYHVHTHLDWQTIDEHLNTLPNRLWVAYRGKQLVGAVGASEPMAGTCWLRMIAINDNDQPVRVLTQLWEYTRDALNAEGVYSVSVLLLRDWLREFVVRFGYQYDEDIVTLYRHTPFMPDPYGECPEIHPIELDDLDAVEVIDHQAFPAQWRLSRSDLRLGIRSSTYSTLAVVDGRVVGYQLATTHGMNGHLARLGVFPSTQGRGIGGWLVRDMLTWFGKRRTHSITVNTQASNVRSQRLYERYGFQRNGYDLGVWTVQIS